MARTINDDAIHAGVLAVTGSPTVWNPVSEIPDQVARPMSKVSHPGGGLLLAVALVMICGTANAQVITSCSDIRAYLFYPLYRDADASKRKPVLERIVTILETEENNPDTK